MGARSRRTIARERQAAADARRRLVAPRPARRRRTTSTRSSPSANAQLDPRSKKLLDMWPKTKAAYAGDEYVVKIRDKEIRTSSRLHVAVRQQGPQGRVAALEGRRRDPALAAARERARAASRSPAACSRSSARTRIRRACSPARAMRSAPTGASICSPTACRRKRLSTAFDSVTLYGFDPDRRPDIYGKVGNSGVSIATLDDMKVLYSGFDLCDPKTSVSMTINGPAPTLLAMFMNTAIDQQLDKFAQRQRPRADRRRGRRRSARGRCRRCAARCRPTS